MVRKKRYINVRRAITLITANTVVQRTTIMMNAWHIVELALLMNAIQDVFSHPSNEYDISL
jgi:hypothetical protein